MRITFVKEAFQRKMPLLTSKLNIELKKKLVRCYVWSIALYGFIWTQKKIGVEVFGALKCGAGGEWKCFIPCS